MATEAAQTTAVATDAQLPPASQPQASEAELAAGEQERARSVFLVGDAKQSIYRFRRAEPALMHEAQNWLGEHLSGITQPLAVSWRSAPAITDAYLKGIGGFDAQLAGCRAG